MKRILSIIAISAALLISVSCKPSDPKNVNLTDKNFINLRGVINKEVIDQAIKDLDRINKLDPNGPKYIVIESPGGSVFEGARFLNFAYKIKNLHTITIFAASMASAIVQALPGKRYIVPRGQMMFHRGGFVKTMEGLQWLEQINSKRIGLTIDEYRMKVLREWWLFDSENLRRNTADKMLDISCDKSIFNKFETIKITNFLGFESKIELSKCPLVVQPIWN